MAGNFKERLADGNPVGYLIDRYKLRKSKKKKKKLEEELTDRYMKKANYPLAQNVGQSKVDQRKEELKGFFDAGAYNTGQRYIKGIADKFRKDNPNYKYKRK